MYDVILKKTFGVNLEQCLIRLIGYVLDVTI